MSVETLSGTVWKLGTNWGRGKRDFYDILITRNIVVGVSERIYNPGDIVALFKGFKLLAVCQVTDTPVPVTTNKALEADFETYEIEYEDWVNYATVKIYEVDKEDSLVYQEQKGIVRIHQKEIRSKIISLFNKYVNLDQEKIESNTNLKLYKDAPSTIDFLGRKPFVEALRQYIDRLWGDEENNDAYTIHINGEWGSGKSTVLTLLQSNLENEGSKWVVANFNAWQNQHIDVPWWVFLDTVYKTILEDGSFGKRALVYAKEQWWRIFSINKNKWFTFLIFLFVLITTLLMKSSFLDLSSLFSGSSSNNKVSVVVSIISLVGTIGVFIYAIINSLLPGSEDAAINFKKNVRDPMQKIKDHYASIINYSPKNVAVFIDDIDRCDPKFVVSLLEGIQTLFRTGKVLYVIAGDASWIRESFEIHYGDLKKIITKPGQSLGNFFVEKTLQQSVNMPQITNEIKKAFWNILLDGTPLVINEADYSESLGKIDDAKNETQINEIIREAKTDIERTILRQKAAKKIASTKNLKNIEHYLLKYYELLEPNPRSMKRLVNSLALEKASTYLSGRNELIDEDSLVRWCILKSRFPLIANEIKKDPQKINNYFSKEDYPEIAQLLEKLNSEKLYLFIV